MNRSLLIVDADPTELGALTRRFIRAGYDVVALGHPRQALEAASFRQFRVAVVDAGHDGLEFVRRLGPVQHALQAVVLSGAEFPDDQHWPAALREWFVKPCRWSQLEAAVERAFGNDPAAEPQDPEQAIAAAFAAT